jgi:exonuclease SbcC
MIIQNIKLNNIRSYTNASIDFPKSSVLLSGDVGSGKSSILLALEFALFGLSKKELSGDALLRNGKTRGSVEVALAVNGKNIIIKRSLKKSGDKILQDSGHIIENDLKKEGTAVELKSRILNILGYPKEALTKKSLIFRYTVYTPQEEMKRILLDDSNYRIDTLRKVLGIDKYKRIQENSAVFLRSLKERTSNYEGQIEDLDILKAELKETAEKIRQVGGKIESMKPEFDETENKLQEQKQKVTNIEKKGKEKQELQHKLAINEIKLKEKLEHRKLNAREIELFDLRTDELDKELLNLKIEKPDMSVEEINKLIRAKEKELLELVYEIKDIELKKKTFEEEMKQILELSKCPTCKQDVNAEYKQKVKASLGCDIESLGKKFMELSEVKKKEQGHVEKLKDDSYNTHKKEKQYELLLNNREHIVSTLQEIKTKKANLESMQAELKKEIGQINVEIMGINETLKAFGEIELEAENRKLDELRKKLHGIEVKIAELQKERSILEKETSDLQEKISEKEKIKLKIRKIDQYHNWLENFFAPLMATIEKHVMAQVHREFNSLFQEWFDVLLDDENVSVRLDDEFSPIVEQNGYEIDIANMSGGEKTAIALTYRLALNKVINDLITTINTKDLLILDEPTDGFSAEQLDRMRDVLDKLNLNQVIIVSHESKIESFVENTIRISKNEHISSIL